MRANAVALILTLAILQPAESAIQNPQSALSGPVVVVETSKGTFAFETYPGDAPKTVDHILALVKRGFYDGQRIHRALPGFVVQWGDPQSRDLNQQADWGRGAAASSGTPIGISEITKKRQHTRAVGVSHINVPRRLTARSTSRSQTGPT